jgi:hypothetical protein
LVNRSWEPVTVAVNGRTYQLAPGESRPAEPVQAGTFTYQVLGLQPHPQQRTLAARETFTVTVNPPH